MIVIKLCLHFNCSSTAFHEFPPDLFSHRARARGAVIVHMFVAIYMFYALAVVCDDYFIASLEECSQVLRGLSAFRVFILDEF